MSRPPALAFKENRECITMNSARIPESLPVEVQPATSRRSMWWWRAALASGSRRNHAVRKLQSQWNRVKHGLGSLLLKACWNQAAAEADRVELSD